MVPVHLTAYCHSGVSPAFWQFVNAMQEARCSMMLFNSVTPFLWQVMTYADGTAEGVSSESLYVLYAGNTAFCRVGSS